MGFKPIAMAKWLALIHAQICITLDQLDHY